MTAADAVNTFHKTTKFRMLFSATCHHTTSIITYYYIYLFNYVALRIDFHYISDTKCDGELKCERGTHISVKLICVH